MIRRTAPRSRGLGALLAGLAAGVAASPAPADEPAPTDAPGWSVRWQEGIRVERSDGAVRMILAGRVLNDWALIEQSSGVRDRFDEGRGFGTEIRQARLTLSGEFRQRLVSRLQVDLEEGQADLADVYAGLLLGGRRVRILVGHQKQPFSLEGLASRNDLTFLERGGTEAFVGAERDTGLRVLAGLADGRATLSAGAFRISDEFGDGFGDEEAYTLAARVSGQALRDEEGRRRVHVGAGYAHQFRGDPPAPQVAFSQAAGSNLGAALADTGAISEARNLDLGNLELAATHGVFHFQSELTGARVQRDGGEPELLLWGAYAKAGVFLTGESRPYDEVEGIFRRPAPLRPFDPGRGGWGAFEVAARFSYLDLDDADVSGGVLSDTTLGLNWYLFANARIMLNYVHAVLHGVGRSDAGQIRFQVTF